MNIIKTTKYFGIGAGQLTDYNKDDYTKEECLIFDEGTKVHFLDDQLELDEYLQSGYHAKELEKGLEIKVILETVNERIVVILH